MVLPRAPFERQIDEIFAIHSVCAILGPRQCGKTTPARQYIAKHSQKYQSQVHFFDLENPRHVNALSSPTLTLLPLEGLIVID